MLNQILRPIARRALQKGTRLSHDHGHGHSTFKKVTFDEACVPEGCWKENFAKKQRKYNAQLAVGVTAFVLTIFSINKFDILFFNYFPPEEPKE